MKPAETTIERAKLLHALHIKGDPLIVFNIWDAGSAKAIQEIGAKVIATGSSAVAGAHGYEDRQKLPFDLVLANLNRIFASVTVPVTIDLEAGYGKSPAEVAATVGKVIEAGAVGINFEDQIMGTNELYSITDQCARIRAIRKMADDLGIPIFINARTDVFLKSKPADHGGPQMEEAMKRASAFAESGANGFFVPGLRNANYIQKLCKFSSLPVNILVLPDVPSTAELARLGVARVSYGPIPYRQVMEALKEAGRKALAMKE